MRLSQLRGTVAERAEARVDVRRGQAEVGERVLVR